MSEDPITNEPAFGGDPAAAAPRAAAPGVQQGTDFKGLLNLMVQAGIINQKQLGTMLGALTSPEESPPSPFSIAVPGEIRGQGLGNPASTGLAGFYRNNPNMRVAEFDPTGSKNIGRFTQGYARQDQLGAAQHGNAMMDQRNQYATGLSDLWKTRDKMTGKGWVGPAKPGAVWSPLGE